MSITWTYRTPGPTIDRFMLSNAFVRGIRGAIGSGKSTACCMELWRRAREQAPNKAGVRQTRWAVIRNTIPELKSTTIKTWHQWFPQHVGTWRELGPTMHRISANVPEDGTSFDMEVIFLGLDRPDDVSKLLSLELTGAWINEAREVPRAVLEGLTGRVGRFPPVRDGGCTWSGVIMDTNPPDSDHWWYRLAEETRPEGYEFFAQPAGDGPDAENLENLPPNYYRRAAAGKKDDWIKVYIRGEYGFAGDGKPVFPEYVDGFHCRIADLVPDVPLQVGMDFGLTPAAVIGQLRPDGRWVVRDELVTENMGAARFAEELGRKLRGEYGAWKVERMTGDPAGDQRAQTDEQTVFQVLASNGIKASPAPSNDFLLRREAVAGALTRTAGGEPGFVVHPDCRQLRKALAGAYCYRRVQVAGDERYKDVPDKGPYSHVADALQYLLLGGGEGARTLNPKPAVRRRPDPWDVDDRPRGSAMGA